MKTWKPIKGGNIRSTAAHLDPLPSGPYCLVPQFEMTHFEANPHAYQGLIKLDEFETRFGYATYAVGPDFKPLKVAYDYDSGD